MSELEQIRALCDQNKLQYHHTSLCRGYVSVRSDGYVSKYNGRFGTGYTVKIHNPNSTIYCYIEYYVKPE